MPGTETSATFSGLLPFTFYIVRVSGRTSKGLGPVSDDLIVRTSEDSKDYYSRNYGELISFFCSYRSSFIRTSLSCELDSDIHELDGTVGTSRRDFGLSHFCIFIVKSSPARFGVVGLFRQPNGSKRRK